MLAELDVVVFLRAHDSLDRVAERVFGSLHSEYQQVTAEDGNGVPGYQAHGIGFEALLFANTGEIVDPEFESYQYGLEISSSFWCVELDTLDLEGPLSEYFARKLAFDLDLETATEVLLETTEESEVFEIRAYRRNPQYRFDMAPTIPRVFVIESRQVEESFDDFLGEDGEEIDEDETVEDLEAEDPV